MELASKFPDQFYELLASTPGNQLKSGDKIYRGWRTDKLTDKIFFAFSHDPKWAIKLPTGTTTITCLRDPLARATSYYNYILSIRDEVRANKNHPHVNMPDLAWAHDNWRKFICQVPHKHISNQLWMFDKEFNPASAATQIEAINIVLTTETLNRSINNIPGVKLIPRHFGATKVKRSIPHEFSDELRNMLRSEYEMINILKDKGVICKNCWV